MGPRLWPSTLIPSSPPPRDLPAPAQREGRKRPLRPGPAPPWLGPARDALLWPFAARCQAHAARASGAWEGLIDLGKRQQSPQRLRSLAASRRRAPVSASTISVSRPARAQGRGAGRSPVRPPAVALGCRRRDLMRMSSCKLSLLRTLHPVPAASRRAGSSSWGAGRSSSSSSKGSAPRPPSLTPPAGTKGQPARR